MNLVKDPWIPAVTLDGTPCMISLLDVFVSGDKFSDLAVRPHERVSLMRLFLCVAHAALNGPKDEDAWEAAAGLLPDAAQKYLSFWEDSFELFHPTKPWLQVSGISGEKKTPVSKLNFSLATGENTTLFDHEALLDKRHIELSATIVSMLTFQCFSPGGLISQVVWNGIKTGKSSKDAPCVTASMLHAFVRGKTLFETICLNLLSVEDIREAGGEGSSLGRPVWEHFPGSFDDQDAIKNATQTYIGRLVPMTRLILLSSDGQDMYMGDGLVYPTFTDGFQSEATATVYVKKEKSKETRALLSYQPGKAVWRQLTAMMVKPKAGKPGGALALLNLHNGKACDAVVCALGRDQAKILDTVESVFSIPKQLFSDASGLATYESSVKEADDIHARLVWAMDTYRKELDSDWESRKKKDKGARFKLVQTTSNYYWTTVEKNLDQLWAVVAALGTDLFEERENAWRKMLFATACEVYRVVCRGETVRHRKSYLKGGEVLIGKKHEKQEAVTEHVG